MPEGQSVVAAVPMPSAAVTLISASLTELDAQLQVSEVTLGLGSGLG